MRTLAAAPPLQSSTEVTISPPGRPRQTLDELIAASARGDEQAFRCLYRATCDTLFGVAVRILKRSDWAEEVLQESYVSVWRHAGRYDKSKGAAMTWLIRIVRNQAFDWVHPSRPDGFERLHATSVDWLDDAALELAQGPGVAEELAWLDYSHQAGRIAACLRALDPRQRQSIVLVFFHGLSHGDLAGHLQQPLGTVKAWVRRGLKSLRACLAAQHI